MQFRYIDGYYLAPTACLLRDVRIGEDSSIWFNTVLRGDDAAIHIGRCTNIQDLTMVHPDPDKPMFIGDDVTIGHSAIIHCLKIGSGSLIGMGAILMEDVEIGNECLIAAGALLPPGSKIPARSLVVGAPGKIKRTLTDKEVEDNYRSAEHYVQKAKSYL